MLLQLLRRAYTSKSERETFIALSARTIKGDIHPPLWKISKDDGKIEIFAAPALFETFAGTHESDESFQWTHIPLEGPTDKVFGEAGRNLILLLIRLAQNPESVFSQQEVIRSINAFSQAFFEGIKDRYPFLSPRGFRIDDAKARERLLRDETNLIMRERERLHLPETDMILLAILTMVHAKRLESGGKGIIVVYWEEDIETRHIFQKEKVPCWIVDTKSGQVLTTINNPFAGKRKELLPYLTALNEAAQTLAKGEIISEQTHKALISHRPTIPAAPLKEVLLTQERALPNLELLYRYTTGEQFGIGFQEARVPRPSTRENVIEAITQKQFVKRRDLTTPPDLREASAYSSPEREF